MSGAGARRQSEERGKTVVKVNTKMGRKNIQMVRKTYELRDIYCKMERRERGRERVHGRESIDMKSCLHIFSDTCILNA